MSALQRPLSQAPVARAQVFPVVTASGSSAGALSTAAAAQAPQPSVITSSRTERLSICGASSYASKHRSRVDVEVDPNRRTNASPSRPHESSARTYDSQTRRYDFQTYRHESSTRGYESRTCRYESRTCRYESRTRRYESRTRPSDPIGPPATQFGQPATKIGPNKVKSRPRPDQVENRTYPGMNGAKRIAARASVKRRSLLSTTHSHRRFIMARKRSIKATSNDSAKAVIFVSPRPRRRWRRRSPRGSFRRIGRTIAARNRSSPSSPSCPTASRRFSASPITLMSSARPLRPQITSLRPSRPRDNGRRNAGSLTNVRPSSEHKKASRGRRRACCSKGFVVPFGSPRLGNPSLSSSYPNLTRLFSIAKETAKKASRPRRAMQRPPTQRRRKHLRQPAMNRHLRPKERTARS